MIRKPILAAWLVALGFAVVNPAVVDAAERPNFVFFLVDDLGFMDVSPNNPDTFYETPNVAKLAARSMRFTDGYAANPVCSPTRYSIMTGKYPSRVDATNFFAGRRSDRFLPAELNDRMPLEEVTIAEALHAANYRTFFAGKWHLGPSEEYWPTQQGFDVNKGGHRAGAPFQAGKYFVPYDNPRLQDGPPGEHLTARLAQETCDFVADNQDRPFLAYLAFYTVHTPLMAPPELVEKYRAKAKRLGLDDAKAFGEEEQIWEGAAASRRVRTLQAHATYAAMVESMDRAVGKVLDQLDASGLTDNTVVMFMSDNGGLSTSEGSPTSNLPLRGGKGWLYEGGIREPFMISWPGVTSGQTCSVPVASIDFFPTITDLAGLPESVSQACDGLSLKGLLQGDESLDREALYWHYPHYSNQGGFPGGAIRMGDWKLIERYEDGRVHLYNLAKDLGEQQDLADEYPERVARMRAKLHNWYQEVDAKFLRAKGDGPQPWQPDDLKNRDPK